MRHGYTLILNHPVLAVAILSLLMMAEMGVARWSVVPIEYEWLLQWLLILTILAWVSMAGRIGVLGMADCRVMRCTRWVLMGSVLFLLSTLVAPIFITDPQRDVTGLFGLAVLSLIVAMILLALITPVDDFGIGHLIFLVAPLGFLALIGLYHLDVMFFGERHWELLFAYSGGLPLGLIGGALVLLIHLSSNHMSRENYKVVVLRSLGCAVFVPLTILAVAVLTLGSGAFAAIGASFVTAPLVASVLLAVLVTWWLGVLSPRTRKIIVSVVGLWMMYVVMGWFWLATMDNGLSAFTGDERAAAEVILDRSTPPTHLFGIERGRVFMDADGQFDVVFYTWWGLKARYQGPP